MCTNNMLKLLRLRCLLKFNLKYSRSLTTSNLINQIVPKEKDGHLALVSTSTNIFYNLALENYLAESYELKNRGILLIWLSDASIVWGRHQNPWLECNVKEAHARHVSLARRYSGGGCVYHDLGNLNISFISNRLKYDRKSNLNLIKETLESEKFNLNRDFDVWLSPRHDIFIKSKHEPDTAGFKITGSASRLAKQYSYHHCTLLFDSNIKQISYLLKSNLVDCIKTKATPSVSSKCTNMKNHTNSKNLTTNDLVQLVCEQYWSKYWSNWSIETLFNYIDPEHPELVNLYETNLNELKSWEFRFGSTPQFDLVLDLGNQSQLTIVVSNGSIKEFRLDNINDDLFKENLNKLIGVRLINSELVDAYRKNFSSSEFVSNNYFIQVLDFLNKNFS